MNADKNKLFSYRRFIGGSIFFALPPRDSVLTGARPGRSGGLSLDAAGKSTAPQAGSKVCRERRGKGVQPAILRDRPPLMPTPADERIRANCSCATAGRRKPGAHPLLTLL